MIPRRLAAAVQPDGAPPFPLLAQRWAASHRGKAYTDQVSVGPLLRRAGGLFPPACSAAWKPVPFFLPLFLPCVCCLRTRLLAS